MSRLTVGSLEGLSENSNVISVPTGHTLNAVDGLQIGGVGVGEWQSWTPTWNSSVNTMGDATVNGKYCQIGDIVFVYLKVIFGSTTSWASSAAVYFDVPVAIHSDDKSYSFRGSVTFVDTGTGKYHGTMRPVGSDYGFIPEEYGLAGTTVGSLLKGGNLQGDNPFVWAAGDELICNFWYRSA